MLFFHHLLIYSTLVLFSAFTATSLSQPTRSTRSTILSNGIPLRILPLGDSITWGYLSSTGNGYRADLLNFLSPTNPVQYIGSQRSGSMPDNYNEGHPGALINQIAGYANASLPLRPNLILLMAGTNDINDPVNASTAPHRLGLLIDELQRSCPDAVLLVAQLTPVANSVVEARIQVFNEAVPAVVERRVRAGGHILVVDMSAYVTVADLQDGLHPTDEGYELMAEAWYGGIEEAAAKGWLHEPIGWGWRGGNGTYVGNGSYGRIGNDSGSGCSDGNGTYGGYGGNGSYQSSGSYGTYGTNGSYGVNSSHTTNFFLGGSERSGGSSWHVFGTSIAALMILSWLAL